MYPLYYILFYSILKCGYEIRLELVVCTMQRQEGRTQLTVRVCVCVRACVRARLGVLGQPELSPKLHCLELVRCNSAHDIETG